MESMLTTLEPPVMVRMQALIDRWQAIADRRAIFLGCYQRMTANMLTALARGEFMNADWVNRLLEHFAGYYFTALDQYEHDATAAPAVWQLAFDATHRPKADPLQDLLLGVSAHINYDLVLALTDALRPEWSSLSDSQRTERYADYCEVNAVIGRTIDAVQNEVLDPVMPIMWLIDALLGPVDEMLISHLITHWRDIVWQDAMRLVEAQELDEQARLIRQVEEAALHLGHIISPAK